MYQISVSNLLIKTKSRTQVFGFDLLFSFFLLASYGLRRTEKEYKLNFSRGYLGIFWRKHLSCKLYSLVLLSLKIFQPSVPRKRQDFGVTVQFKKDYTCEKLLWNSNSLTIQSITMNEQVLDLCNTVLEKEGLNCVLEQWDSSKLIPHYRNYLSHSWE